MVPAFLIVSDWIAFASTLPRAASVLVLLISAAMLVVGMPRHRYFVVASCFGLAWVGGEQLGILMHVTSYYVAAPLGLAAGGLAWPRITSKWLLNMLIGLFIACCFATALTYGLRIANFWVVFSIGLAAGVVAGFVARRFTAVVMFAVLGAAGFLLSLGGVVRAASGFFAPGAHHEFMMLFVVVWTILVVASIPAQLHFESVREL